MEKLSERSDPRGMTPADFGRLFAACRTRFERIACRYVRNAAVAEDLVSDSFMAGWEHRDRIPDDANFQAYTLAVLRNKCLDWLRAQRLHLRVEQELYLLQRRVLDADIRSLEAFDPAELFSREIAQIVAQSLDRLPPLTREVFLASRFGGKSYREIAREHAITERRVEFELTKALRVLRVALKDHLPVFLILFAGLRL